MGYYSSHMTVYTGLMKDPPVIWAMFIDNLCWAVLLVYIIDNLSGIKSFGKGVIAGMIIAFLIALNYDIFSYAMMNLYSRQVLVVDVLANAFMGGVMGGLAGWILDMGKGVTRDVSRI